MISQIGDRRVKRRSRALRALASSIAISGSVAVAGFASFGGTAQAAAGKPVNGGILTLASDADNVPATFFSGTDAGDIIFANVFNTLTSYAEDSLTPQPELATSWKYLNHGRTELSLQLRKGVKFSDGSTFTSKDVAFSLQTIASTTYHAQYASTAAAVTSVNTKKPYQVTLTFAHPLSNIFDLLAEMPILEPSDAAGFQAGTSYVGTGPYKFVSWTPSQKIVLTANKSYWGGKPYLSGITLDVDVPPQTQVSELRTGQIQVALDPNSQDVDSLQGNKQFSVLSLSGAEQYMYLGFNVSNSALSNVKLRQAINYAISRKTISSEAIGGGAVASDLPWPSYSPAYSAKLNTEFSQNVAKARALVSQAGSVPSIPIAYLSTLPNVQQVAALIQANLQAVGITTTLDPLDLAQFTQGLIGGQFQALWVSPGGFAQYTPSTLAVSAYPFNAAKNASNFSSATYSQAAKAAWWTTSGASPAATKAYTELDQTLLNNLFVSNLSVFVPRIVTVAKLHGVTWGKMSPQLFLGQAYLAH